MSVSTDVSVYVYCDDCSHSIHADESTYCGDCVERGNAKALKGWLDANSFELTDAEQAFVQALVEAIESGRPLAMVRDYSKPIGGAS